jgi:hypothetical protein
MHSFAASLILLSLICLFNRASAQVTDPVAFTAIKGSVNGNYIAFQALIVNNHVSISFITFSLLFDADCCFVSSSLG